MKYFLMLITLTVCSTTYAEKIEGRLYWNQLGTIYAHAPLKILESAALHKTLKTGETIIRYDQTAFNHREKSLQNAALAKQTEADFLRLQYDTELELLERQANRQFDVDTAELAWEISEAQAIAAKEQQKAWSANASLYHIKAEQPSVILSSQAASGSIVNRNSSVLIHYTQIHKIGARTALTAQQWNALRTKKHVRITHKGKTIKTPFFLSRDGTGKRMLYATIKRPPNWWAGDTIHITY